MACRTPLTAALALLALLHAAASQSAPAFTTPDLEELTNKTTLVDAERPLARALEPHKNLLAPLLAHITFISQAVQSSAKAARENVTNPITTTCNLRGGSNPWTVRMIKHFAQLSWGDVDDDCVTDVYGAGASEGVAVVGSAAPGFTSRQVYDAITAHARAVDSVAGRAPTNAQMRWPAAARATAFTHSERTQTCAYDFAAFVRREGEWFVVERITNEEKDLTLGEGSRLFMHEYIRLSDGELRNALVEPLVSSDSETFERGTTTLTEDAGPVSAAEFSALNDENLAIREALRSGEHSTQQASDATTSSNIAILALPLAMNIVPVALIADVNTLGMLVYTLLTDILTTIPLLIKGVEVLAIGVDTNVAVVTRITGATVLVGNKAGEVWAAECRANGDLTVTGVALICVALGFMVGGVAAEIIAKRWVKRKGATGKASAGLVMAGVVGRGLGSEKSAEKHV